MSLFKSLRKDEMDPLNLIAKSLDNNILKGGVQMVLGMVLPDVPKHALDKIWEVLEVGAEVGADPSIIPATLQVLIPKIRNGDYNL
jgi:hypothetical protein